MALENEIDNKTRDIIGKAQKASKTLISMVDDILKLTKTEDDGPVDHLYETFNLKAIGLSYILLIIPMTFH